MASVVVQASQCPSDSGCPNDNEPKHVVSLLQTKLQMNVLEDGGEDTAGGAGGGVGRARGGGKEAASPVLDVGSTIIGIMGVLVAAVGWGSNFIVVKGYDMKDGFAFQFWQ